MPQPRVLHLIESCVVGGAQRTVSTLARTPQLTSRIEALGATPPQSLAWADVLVIHAWRRTLHEPDIIIPQWTTEYRGEYPLILFNHDWEGQCGTEVDLVLVYSAFAATNWRGRQPVSILPGGVRLKRFAKVAASRSWRQVTTVGRLSTLNPGKISASTIGYWQGIDAKSFLIGGDGQQLHLLRTATQDPRVRFLGSIPPSLTHDFLGSIDIFLYDTDWHVESFCYVILEALAAGCVVVAARRGAVPELIKDGVTGFLFDNPREAVSVCNSLLTDATQARSVATAGSAFARRYPSSLMQCRFATRVTEVLQGYRQ